jgi:hypothetical protein
MPSGSGIKMSTVADDNPNGRVLAFWLVLIHFVAGLVCCVVSRNYHTHSYQQAVFIGLVFSQPSLVGLWAGLGTGPWWARLVGVLVGLIYLGGLFSVGVKEVDVNLVFMIVFAGLSVAGLLTVCRYFALRIRPIDADTSHKTAAQFSIRQLMLFTLVVACVMALAKWLLPHVDIDGHFLVLLLIGVPFVMLGLVAVWAILGTRHARLGTIAVLLVAPLLGFGLNMVLQMFLGINIDTGYWITATMTTTFALILSLYAIRRCGFRVRREPKGGLAFEGEEHESGK